MRARRQAVLLALLPALAAGLARADTAADAYRAMGIAPADVLAGTVLNAQVVPGTEKQVIAVTTYLTGKREKHDAVNVRLEVFHRRGAELIAIYSRDFGAERGGNVGDGNLQLVDLDADGVNDIVVSYESYADPLIDERLGEVILHGGHGFRTVWSGSLDYDATRAARNVAAERRDRFHREIDVARTLRDRGQTLYFRKKVIAVAGEPLAEPRIVEESFPPEPG